MDTYSEFSALTKQLMKKNQTINKQMYTAWYMEHDDVVIQSINKPIIKYNYKVLQPAKYWKKFRHQSHSYSILFALIN